MDKRPIGLGCKFIAGVIAGAIALSPARSAWAQGAPAKAGGPGPAAGAPAAAAKPDLTAAKKHYSEGEKKFKAGDTAGALVEFKEANDIKATPQAERYIGLCEDSLAHFQAAAEWYDKFLAHVPEKLASQGDEIRKRVAEIKALPGKVHIESIPPGASVSVDDKPQPAPAPTDIDLPPGPHVVRLTAPGRLPAEKPIEVGFSSSQTLSVDLDPEPPAAPPPAPVAAEPPPNMPPPPVEPRSKVPAYVTGGLAIAAVGVGTVFGVMALKDKSDFDKNPTSNTADNGDTHALIADMAFGVALTFGVTSAVLFLTKDEQPPAAASRAAPPVKAKADAAKRNAVTLTPIPVVGAHSGGAGLILRF